MSDDYSMHPDHAARMRQLGVLNDSIKALNKLKRVDSGVSEFSRKIRVKAVGPDAIIPTRSNLTDAGWDLYASEDVAIRGGDRKLVKTSIAMQIPDEWVGLIWPRSGMSVKKGTDVLAGVIDSGYRGEIQVCLYNTNHKLPLFTEEDATIEIKKGDRIAQILFQRVPDVELVEVDDLSESDRGNKGFGSSGK
jgi:dUTP pyrophosphatase